MCFGGFGGVGVCESGDYFYVFGEWEILVSGVGSFACLWKRGFVLLMLFLFCRWCVVWNDECSDELNEWCHVI